MLFDLVNVSALRLILQQPSPVWKDFKIEDLKVFRSSEVRITSETCYCSYARPAVFSILATVVIHCDVGGVSLVDQ